MHHHFARFAGNGERGLTFEIEMLLAADPQRAFEAARRARQGAGRVAAPEFVVRQNALAGLQRVLDGDGGLRLGDVDPGEPGGPARLVASGRDDGENRLIVEQNLLVGEQRLVGERRRNVVPARDVGGGEHGDDALGGAHRGKIEPAQRPARLVGQADRDVQRPGGLADVVDIGRGAADVQARRIMGERLVDDRRLDFERDASGFPYSAAWRAPMRVASSPPATSISALRRRLAATRER